MAAPSPLGTTTRNGMEARACLAATMARIRGISATPKVGMAIVREIIALTRKEGIGRLKEAAEISIVT